MTEYILCVIAHIITVGYFLCTQGDVIMSKSNFTSTFIAQQLLTTFGKELKSDVTWCTKDAHQQELLDRAFTIDMHEIESKAQIGGTHLVKEFLASKGIELKLPSQIEPLSICAAVVLIILSRWEVQGVEVKIPNGDTYYDGARVSATVCRNTSGELYGLIPLKNDDYVIFEQNTTINSTIQEMEKNGLNCLVDMDTNYLSNIQKDYQFIEFPQVDLVVNRNLDELIGLQTLNPPYEITDAVGQCKLRMNHIGAEVKIAMAGVMKSVSIRPQPQSWVIDDTFCVHFIRNDEMYASILIAPEHFKRVEIDFD